MTKANIREEFLLKLMDCELNLEDRLNIAYGALISQDFPVVGKEQIIIDWFADCLKTHEKYSKTVLKSLQKCLRSDWLSTLNDALDATKLIKEFSQIDQTRKTRHNKLLLSCLLMLLKNSGVQRYCRFEIQPFIEALLTTLELLATSKSKDQLLDSSDSQDKNIHVDCHLDELLDDMHGIFKSTQQRDELRIHLIEDIFPTLLLFCSNYNLKNSSRFHTLMEEVVIGEETEVLINLLKKDTKIKTPTHLKGILKLLIQDGANNIPVLLVSLIFETSVKSSLNKSRPETKFISLFYALVSFAGFKVQLPYETTETSCETGMKLEMLKELVDVLHRHNVATSTESDEGVLADVLVNILKQLISGEYIMSPDLLKAIQSVFQVYPDSARIVFRPFLKHIMFQRKDSSEVLKTYNSLLSDVIQIFLDLNQIEKCFKLFFEGAVYLAKDREFSNLTNSMVLSSGFFSVLTRKLPSLTGNQLNTILGRLEKIFSKEFLPQFEESHTDRNFCLLLKLWVDVLCHVLVNSCLAMSTRWNLMSENINKLVVAVQKLGCEVSLSSELVFLQEFLCLVRVFSDVESLITQYVVSLSSTKILPVVKCKDKSSSVNNLSKSHGFLSPSEWNRIAEYAVESSDTELKNCWFDLLAQKFSRQGNAQVMTHLVLNAESEWLWQNIVLLSGNVPLKHLELFTEHLLTDDRFNERIPLLHSICVISHRDLRLALALQSIKQISKVLLDKHALSKKMIKLTDIPSVIKSEIALTVAECGEEVETADALVEVMNECCWDENEEAVKLGEEGSASVVRFLAVLSSMSIYGFKNDTKRTIFTTLMGLAYDLRREDGLLHTVLNIITGCLDEGSTVIPDSLDRRVLLMWLATVVPPGYELGQSLSRLAVLKVIHSLKQGVDGMSQLLQTNHALLVVILEAIVQVQGNKAFKGKEEFLKLVKVLINIASPIVAKKPKPKLLRLYTVTIQAEFVYFKNKSPVLLDNLPGYLKLLFQQFADNSVIERNGAELAEFVLSKKVDVDSNIKEFVYSSIAEEICKTDLCPMLSYPSTIKSFLEAIPSQRFEQVLDEMYNHQQKSIFLSEENFSVSNTCELWDIVLNTQLDKDKAKSRQKMLVQVLSKCMPLLKTDVRRFSPVVIRLLHSISTNKSIAMSGKLVDLVLVILGLAPTDSDSRLLPDCLSTLNCLLIHRSELMFDRIPAFLQRLRKFLSSVIKYSCVVDSSRQVEQINYSLATASVNQVTRLVRTIVDHHSKHFARLASYLIADFLHLLVTNSVEISIKNELENCVSLLLVLCDNHGIQQLQNLQSPASTELFKSLSSHKSYKYTGKV